MRRIFKRDKHAALALNGVYISAAVSASLIVRTAQQLWASGAAGPPAYLFDCTIKRFRRCAHLRLHWTVDDWKHVRRVSFPILSSVWMCTGMKTTS